MKKIPTISLSSRSPTKQQTRRLPRSPKQIASSEEWLFTALQNIGDAVIATDSSGRITFMNPVAERLTGWTAEEGQGRDCREVFRIIGETTRRESESPVTKVLRDGVVAGLANHTLLISKDGAERSIDDSGSPIIDKNGAIAGVVLIFRDVTGHRSAQKTMQEQYDILQALFDHIPVLIAFFDTDMRYKWVNREWERATGWTLEDLQNGDLIQGLADPADLEKSIRHLQLATPGWRDVRIEMRDGRTTNFSWTNVRLSDGSTIGIGYDLTDRGRSEENLSRDNAWLSRAVVESHHRVKNDLHAICSLVDLELMANPESTHLGSLIRLRSHVQMLAAVHDILTRSKKANPLDNGVSAVSALEEILPLLRQTSGASSINFVTHDVILPVKHGMVLAVVVNELVTNAVKHGSKCVNLNLELEKGKVKLQVSDDGPGFPKPFKRERKGHTGLDLVESMIRIDLQGETRYQNLPNGGACVRISFPAAAA